jgi:hypothetical protein
VTAPEAVVDADAAPDAPDAPDAPATPADEDEAKS